MEIIKKDLRQEAFRLKVEQAQQPQGHLVVILTREDSRKLSSGYPHCSTFVTTHTFQSCWNKPGNPDPRQSCARFDNVPSWKENSEIFAPERQTNN
jgi:hypothetical protein